RGDNGPEAGGGADSSSSSFYASHPLLGDAIPARIGLRDGPGQGQGRCPGWFSVQAAGQLPPCFLMSGCGDHMVPWHEGAEMAHQLGRLGVPVRHLLYQFAGHSDFIMRWPLMRSAASPTIHAPHVRAAHSHRLLQERDDASAAAEEVWLDDGWHHAHPLLDDLPDHGRDLMRIVRRQADPKPNGECSRAMHDSTERMAAGSKGSVVGLALLSKL
ncbi:hypothetical protein QJQ45_024781, partial [Haematococcus lacustris]